MCNGMKLELKPKFKCLTFHVLLHNHQLVMTVTLTSLEFEQIDICALLHKAV